MKIFAGNAVLHKKCDLVVYFFWMSITVSCSFFALLNPNTLLSVLLRAGSVYSFYGCIRHFSKSHSAYSGVTLLSY
jgi:hypothetical protein